MVNVALWNAINEYAARCGGDTSDRTVSDRRMNAVAAVERAILAKPDCEPAHEALAAKFRAESRLRTDGSPEGTRESVERCAAMLDTYAPECFPANELGQVDFARAMMESTADEIRAFFAKHGGNTPGDSPAFPHAEFVADDGTTFAKIGGTTEGGLSKREYLAAHALAGLLASEAAGDNAELTANALGFATVAVAYADALIAELAKREAAGASP